MDPFFLMIIVAAAVVLLCVFLYFAPFFLWISAKVTGVNISLIQLFLMRIRKVPPTVIVRAMIEAHKAGLRTLTRDELEAHYLAGGHVEKVVHALVSASKANIDLSFNKHINILLHRHVHAMSLCNYGIFVGQGFIKEAKFFVCGHVVMASDI